MRLQTQPKPVLVESDDFMLTVDGQPIPCHIAYVHNWRNPLMPDQPGPYGIGSEIAEQFELSYAPFAHVATDQPVTVRLRCTATICEPTVRPLSYGITPAVDGDMIEFTLCPGQQVSVEAHGDTGQVLHIFADLPEENYQRMLDCPAELIGIRGDSAKSVIRDILFENITVGGERLHSLDQMKTNEFVQNVTVR